MVTKELEDSWKQLALELLVTIAENAPAMMRKHSVFLPRIGRPDGCGVGMRVDSGEEGGGVGMERGRLCSNLHLFARTYTYMPFLYHACPSL